MSDRYLLTGLLTMLLFVNPRGALTAYGETVLLAMEEATEDATEDYGDAPDSYGTGAAAGARHTVVPGLHLGDNAPDVEADAAFPRDGTGDGADEDGVSFSSLFVGNMVYTIGSSEIQVTNTTDVSATLHAWVDFDGSGVFDADEYVSQSVPAGITNNTLTTDLMWSGAGVSDISAGVTYARFRLTSDSTIDATTPEGAAIDGEVEDYAIVVRELGTGDGGVCNAEYGLVYSGQAGNIFAVHVDSGSALPLTTNALATANGLSTDHRGRLVYYAEDNTLYAWSPIDQQHRVIDNNFTSYLNTVPAGFDLGSGGAAFFDGDLYQGVDTGTFEIYRVRFVPGSEGTVIQSVTPIGLSAFLNRQTANWGDFIIEDDGVILGQSNGSPQYWTYDLNTGAFTGLTPGANTPSINFQVAKDGSGRLWGLVTNRTIVQMQVVGNTFETVGPFRSTGDHVSFDGAECVRGSSVIGDRVWDDIDGDGSQDPGEPDIENVTVDLIWDLDADGVIDAGEPVLATRTTNGNGYYEFNELIFGNYIVQVTDTNNVLVDRILTSATSAFAVTMPAGEVTIDTVDFGYHPLSSSPEVVLAKRITAVNGDRTQNPVDGTVLNAVVDDGLADSADDAAHWPENYLVGAVHGGVVRPLSAESADRVEYSIYFLSMGEELAENVLVCDRIPENTVFVPDAYNALLPPDAATQSNLLGIAFEFDGVELALSGSDDGDRGYYFPPGVEPSVQFPAVDCGGSNEHGAVVVDLGDLPQSVGVGRPGNAFGTVRFYVQVR